MRKHEENLCCGCVMLVSLLVGDEWPHHERPFSDQLRCLVGAVLAVRKAVENGGLRCVLSSTYGYIAVHVKALSYRTQGLSYDKMKSHSVVVCFSIGNTELKLAAVKWKKRGEKKDICDTTLDGMFIIFLFIIYIVDFPFYLLRLL